MRGRGWIAAWALVLVAPREAQGEAVTSGDLAVDIPASDPATLCVLLPRERQRPDGCTGIDVPAAIAWYAPTPDTVALAIVHSGREIRYDVRVDRLPDYDYELDEKDAREHALTLDRALMDEFGKSALRRPSTARVVPVARTKAAWFDSQYDSPEGIKHRIVVQVPGAEGGTSLVFFGATDVEVEGVLAATHFPRGPSEPNPKVTSAAARAGWIVGTVFGYAAPVLLLIVVPILVLRRKRSTPPAR